MKIAHLTAHGDMTRIFEARVEEWREKHPMNDQFRMARSFCIRAAIAIAALLWLADVALEAAVAAARAPMMIERTQR